MIWQLANRADQFARDIADRHYSRQKPGTAQFAPTGSCVVFKAQTKTGRAYWVTSFPFSEWVKHAWAGAWICSAFRNEGAGKASEMITDALAATRAHYGDPPPLGMVTFVDRKKVKPTMVRGKQVYGWSFRKAGFEECGETKGGLLALQLLPASMPAARHAIGMTPSLFGDNDNSPRRKAA